MEQGHLEALEGQAKINVTMAKIDKETLLEKAHRANVLRFCNKVLRQVLKKRQQWD